MTNSRKRHTPEQVVRKLGQADRMLADGSDVAAVCRELWVSEHTCCRWRNVWMGVFVEEPKVLNRIDDLREVPAAVRFLSCEPLIAALPGMNLDGIDWVIAGGESGAHHRPMDSAWVEDISDQCRDAGVPFFFKQWGGRTPKQHGRDLPGRTWDEMPSPQVRAAVA